MHPLFILGVLAMIVATAIFVVLRGGFCSGASRTLTDGGWERSGGRVQGGVSPPILVVGALWSLAAILIIVGLVIGAS